MPPLTPAVRLLLLVNVVVFSFVPWVIDQAVLTHWFGLWPLAVEGSKPHFWPWQLVTYGFLHGGTAQQGMNLAHIFFNMFALWMFGSVLERVWGAGRFFFYYFFCMAGAGLIQLLVTTMALTEGGFPTATVGASGAVFGLLLAFGVIFPNVKLRLLFFPIPIAAKYFVLLYGLLELSLGVANTQSMIAHFAHLGGMFFGLVLILYWRAQPYWNAGYMRGQ